MGDALRAETFAGAVGPSDTLVHLVGTPRPSPAKAAEFLAVDLPSVRASDVVDGAAGPDVRPPRCPAASLPQTATRFTLASAIAVSFWSAAFSSSSVGSSTLAQSDRPSWRAQAISVPYRAIS